MKSNSRPVLASALGPNGRGAVTRTLRGVACHRAILVRTESAEADDDPLSAYPISAGPTIAKVMDLKASSPMRVYAIPARFRIPPDDAGVPLSRPRQNPSSPGQANESSRYTVLGKVLQMSYKKGERRRKAYALRSGRARTLGTLCFGVTSVANVRVRRLTHGLEFTLELLFV
jgi:hypothetical protein